MTQDINFCQRCGHALGLGEIEDRERPYCPDCGYVVFLDPKVAAVVLVHLNGELLLALAHALIGVLSMATDFPKSGCVSYILTMRARLTYGPCWFTLTGNTGE